MILCLIPLNMSSLMDINELEKNFGYDAHDDKDNLIYKKGCFACGSDLDYVATILIDNNKYFTCFNTGCLYLSALEHIRMGHTITFMDHHRCLIKYLLSHGCEKIAETDDIVQIRQVSMVKKANYKKLFFGQTYCISKKVYSSLPLFSSILPYTHPSHFDILTF
jgi:hypothetical protein